MDNFIFSMLDSGLGGPIGTTVVIGILGCIGLVCSSGHERN